MKIRFILPVALFFFLVGSPPSGLGDDTEIFFGGDWTQGGTIQPNILFVLDTSSSMNSLDGTSTTRLDRMKEALRQILAETAGVNVGLMRFSNPGGPVLFPVAGIDQEVTGIVGETAPEDANSSQVSIRESSDDAEESAAGVMSLNETQLEMATIPAGGGTVVVEVEISDDNDAVEQRANNSMYMNSSDLELVYDGGDQTVGLRFQGVAIPQGSTIVSAVIQFEVDAYQSQDTDLLIQGQDSVDAEPFTTSSSNVSARARTAASVAWNGVPIANVNDILTTPNLSSIVQEIVDKGGWSSGNDMVFIVTGSGRREVESVNPGEQAPKLVVTYETGGGGSASDQKVGLRFQNLMVPQGAIITGASLGFTATMAESSSLSLVIHGDDADNSQPFSESAGDISSRTLTSAAIAWNGVESWNTVGGGYQQSDVTAVIQEIVNRSGWCGGNALSLVIGGMGGPGKRTAASYDTNPSLSPVLNVSWDPDSVPSTGGCVVQSTVKQVSATSDDAEEGSDGTMDLTSSDLELVQEASTQTIGIRFRSLPIPQGATIHSAEIEFEIDEASSAATSLTFQGEASGSASTFSSARHNISTRTKTAASVPWNGIEVVAVDGKLTTPDLTTIVQEIVDRGDWSTGNNLAFIITGSGKRVVESYNGETGAAPKLSITYSGGESAQSTGKTVRTRLIELVDEIQYRSGTPIVGSLYEAARYFRGEGVDFGKTRGNQGSRSEYTRVSHPASYSGGTLVQPVGCTPDNLDSVNCQLETITGSPVYQSPITNNCQENHMVLLSDGSPSVNTAVNRVESLIGSTCSGSGSSKCGHELVAFLKESDQSLLAEDQHVTTHTIGFNFTSSWMRDMAVVYGGGGFYEADSATELVAAFRAIFKDILQVDSSFVAPGVAVNQFNRLTHLNDVYFSLFRPEETPGWVGNLKRYELQGTPAILVGATYDPATVLPENIPDHAVVDESTGLFKDTARSFWSNDVDGNDAALGGAAEKITDGVLALRKIYTYTGAGSPVEVDLQFEEYWMWGSNPLITEGMLDITAEADPRLSGDYRQNLLQWARGVDVLDEDGDGNSTESRRHIGDPLHSKPLIVTYGPNDLTIFFGTNEGFLHAIDVDGGGGLDPGSEVFAFIPQELLKNLKKFYINSGSESHPYGLDGSIAVWKNDLNNNGVIEPDNGDHVYLYVGMRRGGSNYYALDVTDRSAPILKWMIQGSVAGDFIEMGESWSKPVVTKIKLNGVDKNVVIFSGGYDNNQDDAITYRADSIGRAIYMVDAETGQRLWWAANSSHADVDLPLSEMVSSIPSDVAVIDRDLDGYADRMYVGDMGGRVWRFDIDNEGNSGSGNLVQGGIIASLGGVETQLESEEVQKAAHRRFYYAPDLVLGNCQEGNVMTLAIGSGFRAHPLNTQIHDRFYMIRDLNEPGSYVKLDESDLYDATENLISEGDAVERATAASQLAAKSGWLVKLKESTGYIGEKILGRSIVFDHQLMFTSYTPIASDTESCQAQQGISKFYLMNLCNAGPVSNLDGTVDPLNPDLLTKEDRFRTLKRGGIAPEPSILLPAGSTPVVLVGPEQPISDIPFNNLLKRNYWKECSTDALCLSPP